MDVWGGASMSVAGRSKVLYGEYFSSLPLMNIGSTAPHLFPAVHDQHELVQLPEGRPRRQRRRPRSPLRRRTVATAIIAGQRGQPPLAARVAAGPRRSGLTAAVLTALIVAPTEPLRLLLHNSWPEHGAASLSAGAVMRLLPRHRTALQQRCVVGAFLCAHTCNREAPCLC